MQALTAVLTLLGLFVVLPGYAADAPQSVAQGARATALSPVTFATHVAPLVHRHCSPCHHEGQAAPFPLVTYADVGRRADQLLKVIEDGLMPPWLAAPGHGDFANERRLTAAEREVFRAWVAGGAPEGDPRLTPAPPRWTAGWQLGQPDLVVTMERPYELGSEGPDVYRNFVIRVPLEGDRYVRALEFAPGNPRAVHHAFIRVDTQGTARRLEGREPQPGFSNMVTTARMPDGQFLTWNPGTQPIVAPPRLAWKLPRGSDLVLELHLNRTGKPESVRSSVGLYFTDEVPTNTCHVFKLGSFILDFPAGASNVVIRDSLTLPADVDLLSLYPHAHFLCRDMKGYAVHPDGRRESLLWIPRWDFNWQGDYRFRRPVRLPKGTTVHLEFTYDNSTNNPVNPNHPPQRVTYGERSTDEMCELGFQVLAGTPEDGRAIAEMNALHRGDLIQAQLEHRVATQPGDVEALTRLGMVRLAAGQNREAAALVERAARLRPDYAEARHNRGVLLRMAGRPTEALREFDAALRLDPNSPGTHQQRAFAFADLGRGADAERAFERALEADPSDEIAREGLAELRQILQARQPAAPAGAVTPR